MSGIPKMLDYAQVKPRGLNTQYKTMRFSPLTSFNKYITNDIVRFWIPMIMGFWDPYKSYIEIEVEASATDFPYGTAIQVDNSASSFISQMTMFVDGQEVQRIQQYDSVAALLHDAMVTPADQFGQQYQGTGYASHTSMGVNIDSRRFTCAGTGGGQSTYNTSSTGIPVSNAGLQIVPNYTSGYFPIYPRYIDNSQTTMCHAGIATTVNFNNTLQALSTLTPYHRLPRPLHAITATGFDFKSMSPAVRLYPYLANLEQFSLLSNPFSQGVPFADANILAPRPFTQSFVQSSCYGLQGTNAYNFSLYDSLGYSRPSTTANVSAQQFIAPNYNLSEVRKCGYSQAFSEQLSNGSYEPMITPSHPNTWIYRGQFLSKPIATTQRVFQIPLLSALLGVLIPAQSYQLIPMQALQNLMIQFRLNQFAMFTSGYQTVYNDGAVNKAFETMGTQLQRNWTINRIQIFGAIYSFDDFVTQLISQRLSTGGITLSSNGWALGPRFSIANSGLLKNTWQINAGYQSLKTVAFRIQSDDYKKYTFCRKHYYYSGNITQLQLKIANTYIPPQPIDGHAGNILPYGNYKNNAPFIIQLHKTFGKLFNIGQTMYVNSTNFAVNDRPYDITNKLAFATSSGPQSQVITNIDTSFQQPLFHQNRCVGRAIYAFDLQALPHDQTTISGLNTLKWRPFQVIIDVDSSVTNPRDATLMFFLNYDVVFLLQSGQPPQVFGKG